MALLAATLFVVGLLLSGLFSGSETGFYRVTRVRLLLDGRGGDLVSRALLWFASNPALFVATTLVGNNLANYAVSFATVLGVQSLFGGGNHVLELAGAVLLSPVVFVYGELLPKNLFFSAPNRLLRTLGPLFLAFAVLFAPVSAVLWVLGRILQGIMGQTPLRVQLTLARQELKEVLEEGQEVGILTPAQRNLAHSLFSVASQPVSEIAVPIGRAAAVRLGAPKAEVFRLARRQAASILPVTESKGRNLVGYVRIVDLYLEDSPTLDKVRPLLEIAAGESHIAALNRLQTEREELARVVDHNRQTIGLLFADELIAPLFRSP